MCKIFEEDNLVKSILGSLENAKAQKEGWGGCLKQPPYLKMYFLTKKLAKF